MNYIGDVRGQRSRTVHRSIMLFHTQRA